MTRLILINPNTNAATTQTMRLIAQDAAPAGDTIDALTAPFGVALITQEPQLVMAADAVLAMSSTILDDLPHGVIVSAFGDPGLQALRTRLPCPVTGIAEAAMLEAAAGGRRFAVVTTTPGLTESIAAAARTYGCAAQMAGIALTRGDVHAVMADPAQLIAALAEACERAIATMGAEALVIGGGPLALAARALDQRFDLPVIAPISAAVRLALARAG